MSELICNFISKSVTTIRKKVKKEKSRPLSPYPPFLSDSPTTLAMGPAALAAPPSSPPPPPPRAESATQRRSARQGGEQTRDRAQADSAFAAHVRIGFIIFH